jgi:hypothetical protein
MKVSPGKVGDGQPQLEVLGLHIGGHVPHHVQQEGQPLRGQLHEPAQEHKAGLKGLSHKMNFFLRPKHLNQYFMSMQMVFEFSGCLLDEKNK